MSRLMGASVASAVRMRRRSPRIVRSSKPPSIVVFVFVFVFVFVLVFVVGVVILIFCVDSSVELAAGVVGAAIEGSRGVWITRRIGTVVVVAEVVATAVVLARSRTWGSHDVFSRARRWDAPARATGSRVARASAARRVRVGR